MMLIRYWAAHGKPKRLKTLPGGEVTIEHTGSDTIETDGKQHKLERYSVGGIIWGRETLWLDGQGQLVALITIDSGMNPFEAIREGYEAALPIFVTKATNDRLAALSEISRRFSSEPKDKIAIVGGTMIDATGRPPVSDSVIVIEKNRIVAAGPRSQVKIPKGATVIDARGKAVLPGLWDMHAHFNQVEWGPAYLAAGVTTVRDCGNEFEFEVAVRDAINSGRGIGPRLLLAGFIESDHPDDIGIIRANTPEEARAVVGRYKNAGFDQIKIYNSVRPDLVPVITAGAHRLGLTVTGHVPRGMNPFQAVEAGMDQINHIGFIYRAMTRTGANQQGAPPKIDLESAEARRDIQFFKEHGTVVDPTLANYELSLRSTDVPIESFEPSIKKVAKELIAPLRGSGVPPAEAANARTRFEQYLALVGALHRAGVPIVAGSDTWVPGHTLHRELELYVKAGLTPMEAIQAATIVPARAMKMEKEVGTIEVGKRADLIIIDGNPLESVSNIRKVRRVVTNGRIYDCAQLWRSAGFQP
jgi:imidazolonepropionase-like amidohydrolase